MKKCVLSLVLALTTLVGIGQSIPETPSAVEFADVNVVLSTEARQRVSSEVQRLLTPNSTYLNQKVERMQLFFPIIERILEEENVPADIKYLAVLESDLHADAVSPTKAVGYWQFKDFTAKEMGLTLSPQQDDRKNLHLSTRAAAQYLKKQNQIFKNWVSSTLAYTVGAGGAANLVPVDWSFSSEIKLDKNPHPYLVKAIAHKIAYSHKLSQTNPSAKTLVEYPAKGKRWNDIARETQVAEADIRQLNTWLNASQIPSDKDYVVIVRTAKDFAPKITEKAKDLAKTDYISIGYPKLKRQTLVVTSTDQPVFYDINGKKGIMAQAGDEIAQVARKGKISIYKFLSLNDLTDRDRIKDGTVYYLQKKAKKGPVPYHTATENQSLWDVAHMYGIRLKNLKKYNRIEKEEPLELGRVVWLQKKRPKNTPIQYNKALVAPPEVYTPEPTTAAPLSTAVAAKTDSVKTDFVTHRVLENETLFSLAKKYGTTVDRLRELNRLGPFENIKYNQRLLVPYTAEPEDDWVEDSTQVVLMPKRNEETAKAKATEVPVRTAEPVKKAETKTQEIVLEEPRKEDRKPLEETLKTVEEPRKVSIEPRKAEPVAVEEEASESVLVKHRVARGETLFSIAKKYDITVHELRRLNNMSSSETLKFGTNLNVPGKTIARASSTAAAAPTAKTTVHTVKRGETLFSIANTYKVSVSDIKEWNNLRNNNILFGQKLKIGGAEDGPSSRASSVTREPASTLTYHTVRSGETLFSVAKRYGVTVNQLKSWNNMKSNTLVKGKRLIVKK
jgi:membrane-bound lytic murein transglycosylase D